MEGVDEKTANALISGILPLPSKLVEIFNFIISDGNGMQGATEWLYDFSVRCGYVPLHKTESCIHWHASGTKGGLHITIDTCKRDSDIHLDCPGCPKCKRTDLSLLKRKLPISLNGENWLFNFSPLSLFPQHFIFAPEKHIENMPFRDVLSRLIDAVEYFPHYFLCSADSYEPYALCGHMRLTGGLPESPLFSAPPRMVFDGDGQDVTISVPDWYNTVIRVESLQRSDLFNAVSAIAESWISYSNKGIGILNAGGANKIDTVLRINERGEYCCELVLRNGKIGGEAGVLIPRGITLLESAGAFILSGEIADVAESARARLSGKTADVPKGYAKVVDEIVSSAQKNADPAQHIEEYIQNACESALKATAVFREDGAGNIALIEFLSNIGYTIKG